MARSFDTLTTDTYDVAQPTTASSVWSRAWVEVLVVLIFVGLLIILGYIGFSVSASVEVE